jgi:dTDP-4-amino-4,6-dideoxygalactose transaminase
MQTTTALKDDLKELPRKVASRWPMYEADEIAAATEVLQSGRVNALVHGDHTRAFEKEFSEFVGMPFACAVANGTVALELALRALGIGPGDEVIVPARSFFASVSCVLAVGAEPAFADVRLDTQNIDPASVARMITPRTRAVICVHLAGKPCDMDALVQLCQDHAVALIEDCAQAHGATYRGRMVGSFGDCSAFSFCTDKIMSTGGEGGISLFRTHAAWETAFAYKDHGKNPVKMRAPATGAPGEFRFTHDSFGSNFRLTELQAAIGRIQLGKLPQWLETRRANAARLMDALGQLPGLIVDPLADGAESAWYKFYVRVDPARLPRGMTRSDVLAGLIARGIQCGSGSCPDMSREGAFGHMNPRRDGDLANAGQLGLSTIMLPVDHLLTSADIDAMIAAFREVLA